MAAALNGLRPNAVAVHSFYALADFARVMRELVETTGPFAVAV